MILGVDFAAMDGNKPVDWKAAFAAGVRFAILRASYSTAPDQTFSREAPRARAAGIVVGPYVFPIQGRDLRGQLDAAQRSIGPVLDGDLNVAIDVEYPHGLVAAARASALRGVLDTIHMVGERFGAPPILYTSERVWDGEDADSLDADASGIDQQFAAECAPWLARYPFRARQPPMTEAQINSTPWPAVPKAMGVGDVWIHQIQGDALGLPGFSSTVDINRFRPMVIGERGTRVSWVQRRIGQVEGTPGVFDAAMAESVKEFQRLGGLLPDGVIGLKTFVRLTHQPQIPTARLA